MDADKLVSSLSDLHLWTIITLGFVLGVIGAGVHVLATAEAGSSNESLDKAKSSLRAVLAGGIAAVAVLWVTNPTSGIAFVGGSLVAGYAGKAVLDGLAAKLTATVAQREAALQREFAVQARRDATTATARADAAKLDATLARRDLARLADSVGNDAGAALHVKDLARGLVDKTEAS